MPALKNPKHEQFAQELLTGVNAGDAYVSVGYKRDDGNASRLVQKVQARVQELTRKSAARAEVTLASLIQEAGEIQAAAIEDGAHSAAVQALTAKAKLSGHWIERAVNENINAHYAISDKPMSQAEWDKAYTTPAATAVSADGIYLSTDVSAIFIRKTDHKPLCLGEFDKHFGDVPDDVPYNDDTALLNYMCDAIKSNNPDMTPSEELFLDLYFGTLMALHQKDYKKYTETCNQIGVNWVSLKRLKRHKTPKDVWRALLPIPEMQIYVQDPLSATKSYEPKNNFRVDYGFWDGTRLIVVEIDGAEPSGYARDIRRDRLLRMAGVDVIHILNVELAKHNGRALQELLPRKFFGHDWDYEGERPDIIPF